MKLSKKSEYALKALIELAITYGRGGDVTLISEIAERNNIPPRYLEQILLGLKKSGILISRRGVGGGYALAISPEKIRLGDIIRSVDGPLASLYSPRKDNQVILGDEVSFTIHSFMKRIGAEIKDTVDNISLKDMTERTLDMIEERGGVLNYAI